MNPIILFLRQLGGSGAANNARRSCHEHDLTLLRAEALGRRLAEAFGPRNGLDADSAVLATSGSRTA